jgi:hypothetical protein
VNAEKGYSSHAKTLREVTCGLETLLRQAQQTLLRAFTSPSLTGVASLHRPRRQPLVNPDAVSSLTMLFFRRYPRFTLLLSFLLTASLLLLLTHPPFPSLQPSSDPARPLNSPTSSQGLAARVLRAERAYQKMLLGRDALIAKVGPTPHNVALCVPTYPSPFFADCRSHGMQISAR